MKETEGPHKDDMYKCAGKESTDTTNQGNGEHGKREQNTGEGNYTEKEK